MVVKNKIKAILFDLDGTLIDSIPDLAMATNAMLKDLDLATLPLDQIRTFVGKGTERLVVRSIANDINATTIDQTLFDQAYLIFKQYYQQYNGQASTVFDKVLEGLNLFQKDGFQLGIVTNKAYAFTPPLLEAKKLAHYFQVVIGGDTCANKKPHPEPIIYASKQLDVALENILFIGDSNNDALAAEAAGVPCLILPYGYTEGMAVQNFKVSGIVNDILEAYRWVSGYNQGIK